MERKLSLTSKNELIRLFENESGLISYLIMYCILLSTDKNNNIYPGSMMTLSSRLSLLSKFGVKEEKVSRKNYYDALNFIKNKEELHNIIEKDDDVCWEISGIEKDKLAEFYYSIYCRIIDYLSSLFSQYRFQGDVIAVYPLACVLDYIIQCKGNLPDFDKNAVFYNNEDLCQEYYPAEWSDDFCIPLSCNMDPVLMCDVDNELLVNLKRTNK